MIKGFKHAFKILLASSPAHICEVMRLLDIWNGSENVYIYIIGYYAYLFWRNTMFLYNIAPVPVRCDHSHISGSESIIFKLKCLSYCPLVLSLPLYELAVEISASSYQLLSKFF